MTKLIPILFGCLIIVFHQQLANYYRSFGRDKIPPVKWKFNEQILIIIGLIWIIAGVVNLFK
ncbi:MAG: hypothetical protein NTZ27_04930 [Ignavibacteriales bacterium]|nr:hypothetical protein [Ignavibacteriales bacterium]